MNTASLLTHYRSSGKERRRRRKCNPLPSSTSSVTPLHQIQNVCSLVNPLSVDRVTFYLSCRGKSDAWKRKNGARNKTSVPPFCIHPFSALFHRLSLLLCPSSSHCDFESVDGQAVKVLVVSLFEASQCQSSTSVLLMITSKYSNSCESFSGQASYKNGHLSEALTGLQSQQYECRWECVSIITKATMWSEMG